MKFTIFADSSCDDRKRSNASFFIFVLVLSSDEENEKYKNVPISKNR